ncbi:SDR family NAD(P)-dependent oxidoreductase, partial [bacterium]|nr:SDR family NAD(P)-dependent oxidoreductase [bacterium]
MHSQYWLLIHDDATHAENLSRELLKFGVKIHPIFEQDFIHDAGWLSKSLFSRIIYASWGEASESSIPEFTEKQAIAFLEIVQFLIRYYVPINEPFPPLDILTSEHLSHSGLWGIGRTLQNEYPDWSVNLFACESSSEISDVSSALRMNSLEKWAENQFQIKAGELHVCRLYRSELYPEYRLVANDNGFLDDIKMEPIKLGRLKPNQIQVRVKAISLNFKDVLIGMQFKPISGKDLGSDFSGVVSAIGNNVTKYAVGDRVFGFSKGSLSSILIVEADYIEKIPDEMSFSEAATISSVSMTVYYSLHDLALLKKNDRILIHAGSGGIGLTAIAYAHSVGAIVYATAGNELKRDYLSRLNIQYVYDSRSTAFASEIMRDTEGLGVNVVLNSLTSPGFIEASLQCSADGARFIELGKRDIWTKDKMAAYRKDIHYNIVALDFELDVNSYLNQTLFKRTLMWRLSARNVVLPMEYFPVHQTVNALKYLQQAKHIGKIVITMEQDLLCKDGVYIITGGLSGIGYAVCEWLVNHGIKNIALLSRRAASVTQEEQFTKWRKIGSNVKSYCVDVGDKASLSIVYNQIKSNQGVIKGVIHSAGVIADATILNQTPEYYHRVYQAKVHGAWNLHELTLQDNLEQFIVFSSMTGLLGALGQSNHAGANIFLDNLIDYRRKLGLAGLSINWGVWGETGLALDSLKRQGILSQRSLSTQKGLQAFHEVLSYTRGSSGQIGVMPIDWSIYESGRVKSQPIVSQFVMEHVLLSDNRSDLLLRLKELSEDESRRLLINTLSDVLKTVLQYERSESIDFLTGFFELGMDSLT